MLSGEVEDEAGDPDSGLPWAAVKDFPPQWLDPDNAYVRVGSYSIDVRDRESLVGTAWITDNIINPFVAFQFYQDSFEAKNKVQVFESFALQAVSHDGSTLCKNILLQADILEKMWIIPNNAGEAHWNLFVVLPMKKTIIILDSMTSGSFVRTGEVRRLMQLIQMAFRIHKVPEAVWEEWRFKAPTNIQDQENSYDCGVHVMVWAYMMASGREDMRLPVSEDSAAARMWVAWVLFNADKQWKSPKLSASSLTWPSDAHAPQVTWKPTISRSPLPEDLNPVRLVARLLRTQSSESVDENFNSLTNSSTIAPHRAQSISVVMESFEKEFNFDDPFLFETPEGPDSSDIESPSSSDRSNTSLLSKKIMQLTPVRGRHQARRKRTYALDHLQTARSHHRSAGLHFCTSTPREKTAEGITAYTPRDSKRRDEVSPLPGRIVTSTPVEATPPRPESFLPSKRPQPGGAPFTYKQGENAGPRPESFAPSKRPQPGGTPVTYKQGENAGPRPESFVPSKRPQPGPGLIQPSPKRRPGKLAEELSESDNPRVVRMVRDVIWDGYRAARKHFMTRIGRGSNLKLSAMYRIILENEERKEAQEKCKLCNAHLKYSSLRKLHEKHCPGPGRGRRRRK